MWIQNLNKQWWLLRISLLALWSKIFTAGQLARGLLGYVMLSQADNKQQYDAKTWCKIKLVMCHNVFFMGCYSPLIICKHDEKQKCETGLLTRYFFSHLAVHFWIRPVAQWICHLLAIWETRFQQLLYTATNTKLSQTNYRTLMLQSSKYHLICSATVDLNNLLIGITGCR